MSIRPGLLPLLAAAALAACDGREITDPRPPTQNAALDQQLRGEIGMWGPVPIGAVPAQPAALVDLGRSLFFDKVLSGNRDVSCATCHDPAAALTDRMPLAVGTGGSGSTGSRVPGAGRSFVPRNAPSLLNQGIGHFYTLWDGRINEEMGAARFTAPAGVVLPAGLTSILAAQAMLPVLSRVEMRGNAGDLDRFGSANELAALADTATGPVWRGVMNRLIAIQGYVQKFAAAYPGVPPQSLGFQHAANALAAFQIAEFTRTNSPFDRYLARDDGALTDEEKRGGIVFFGKGMCASCHIGPLLGGGQFANIGVPQFGPGVGAAAPFDEGRGEHVQFEFYDFTFRVPSLRNVELTAPYMHNGAYATLEQVVRHYTNADSALRNYDPGQLDPTLRGTLRSDAASTQRIAAGIDGRLRLGVRLTQEEQTQLVAFLKALTDPAARSLTASIPATVPSGLPVRD